MNREHIFRPPVTRSRKRIAIRRERLWRVNVLTLAFVALVGVTVFMPGTPPGRTTRAAVLCVNPGGTGGCFSSIQAAVDAATPGDTINVAAGTYAEMVQIDKTLTLRGAKFGVDARTRPAAGESIITHPDGPVQILADNVVIDGFTIQGASNDPSIFPTALGTGIWTNPAFSKTSGGHQILNNIIQNNILGVYLNNNATFQAKVQFNLFQNNNLTGPVGGNAIYSDLALNNALIDSNKFTGHPDSAVLILVPDGANVTISNNESAGNGRLAGLANLSDSSLTGNVSSGSTFVGSADIRIFGGINGLMIRENDLSGGVADAVRINNALGGDPNTNIAMGCNSIQSYGGDGLEIVDGYTGTLDATQNWWGSATGPTIASNPGGTGETIVDPNNQVAYAPFLTSGADGNPSAPGFQCGCPLTCPANVSVPNAPNQCGATVTYPAPTAGPSCGTVTCAPISGSFFPVGTTTVTCTPTTGSACTFTVQVTDTQAPTITCPTSVTSVTPAPNQMGTIVTYPPPTASDNCPGVTVTCVPASGSIFPVGTTTVTCTATDASGNTATCSFTVTEFDVCLQDDSNPATVLLFNSFTGAYRFCCAGTTYVGTGTVTKGGGTITLQHNPPDRRVMGKVNTGTNSGTASLQAPPGSPKCSIIDRDIRNNSCMCAAPAP